MQRIKPNCCRLDVNFLYLKLNANWQVGLSGKWQGIRKIKGAGQRILWCRMRLWDSEWPRNWGLDWEGEGWWLCLMLPDLFLTENYNLCQLCSIHLHEKVSVLQTSKPFRFVWELLSQVPWMPHCAMPGQPDEKVCQWVLPLKSYDLWVYDL